jgi:hypothetical protein
VRRLFDEVEEEEERGTARKELSGQGEERGVLAQSEDEDEIQTNKQQTKQTHRQINSKQIKHTDK